MLLVKTRISPSPIAGIGLFAAEPIAKGTPVWKFKDGFDLEIAPEEIEKLSDSARAQFLNYAYLNPKGTYTLCFDDARFFNHSDSANVEASRIDGDEYADIAARDIEEGEELTEDYRIFDSDFSIKPITR